MFQLRFKLLCFLLFSFCEGVKIQGNQFLQVQGDKFLYNGQQVYLSGTNAPWVNYGADFGNNAWDQVGNQWKSHLENLGNAGANSVRVWVHVEGDVSPQYDGDGFITGTDNAGTLISDLRMFLDECQKHNIFMILVLFNGAVLRNQNTINLFWDDSKLTTYIDHCLQPMVEGLKDHPALGAWEVMNEAEGSSPPGQTDPNPCYDFTHLDWSKDERVKGPGWSGANIPIKNILHLHNWVADAIHRFDTKALVNTGSWNHLASTNTGPGDDPVHKASFNHYSNQCLMDAGGRDKGYMDFTQFHVYPWSGQWGTGEPWTVNSAQDYGMDHPVVVGEFPGAVWGEGNGSQVPNGESTAQLVEHLYTHGFAGGWSWAYIHYHTTEELKDIEDGIRQLKGRTDHGNVDVNIN